MIEIKICPICGKELKPEVKQFMSNPAFPVSMEGLKFRACCYVTYSQCPTCNLYVQSPRMDDDDIRQYYEKGLYRKWLNRDQAGLDADEMRRAQADAEILVDVLEGDITSHLDVGSSRGYFLKEIGAEIQDGVEPNAQYNLNAIIDHLFPTVDGANYIYDLVSGLHSLEHTLDPMETLREMASLSRKYLVIEVPSEKSPGGWGRLAHTFHIPEDTFFIMAEKVGFTIKVIYHTPHTLVIMEKNNV